MVEQYKTRSTSLVTAKVDDVVLWVSEKGNRRLLLSTTLVENSTNPDAGLKATLFYQRKGSDDAWLDSETKPLSTVRSGEQVKLALDTKQTYALRQNLDRLFDIHNRYGVPTGESRFLSAEVSSDQARNIQSFLEQNHPNEVWEALVARNPDLVTRLSYARIHAARVEALQTFSEKLNVNEAEPEWQRFFENNSWIFGYGLNYQFMETVQAQPAYGGGDVTGRGGQRGDYLLATQGEVEFTVVVEIKRPDSSLLEGDKPHRNGAWQLGRELIGGVAQIQANCASWEIEGSTTRANREQMGDIVTIQPKGILVIGHLDQVNPLDKRNTFERFRQNLHNPEIITYDELYKRAEFIVENTADQSSTLGAAPGPIDDLPW